MAQDEADFSGESTPAVEKWKEWFARAIEEVGSPPIGPDTEEDVERLRELWRGLRAAQAEIDKRKQGGKV